MIGPIVAVLVAAAPAVPSTGTGMLSPAEMFALMEGSSVHYRISGAKELKDVPIERWADLLWPQQVEPIELPVVKVGKDGRRRLDPLALGPKIQAILGASEPLFQDEKFDEAAALYQQGIALDPDCYILWAHLGDTFMFRGDSETALRHYERAIALNPDDYRLWFYKGRALDRLGHRKEALDAWVTSLVLKPRNPILLKILREDRARLGIEVRDQPLFVPRGVARREGAAVAVYTDLASGPHWLIFATCKALWLGEPEHRKALTGTTDDAWSLAGELECVGALAGAYDAEQKKGEGRKDVRLEELKEIFGEALASEAVIYELASRLDPQVTLTLTNAQRGRIRQYVLRHVLLRTGLQ